MDRSRVGFASCLILIGVGLSLFSPRSAQTQVPQQVIVSNSASQAVPVKQSGTWNVGINNVPTVKVDAATNTVKAAQSGTWNVGINNVPTVKMDATTNTVKAAQSGTWTVGLSSTNQVRVSNAKTSPVPSYNALDAKTPFQRELFMGSAFSVPTGKRLVIEYVGLSAWAQSSNNAGWYELGIYTKAGGNSTSHRISFQPVGGPIGSNRTYYSGGGATRIYADPATSVTTYANWTGPVDDSSAIFSLSGYLVDYP